MRTLYTAGARAALAKYAAFSQLQQHQALAPPRVARVAGRSPGDFKRQALERFGGKAPNFAAQAARAGSAMAAVDPAFEGRIIMTPNPVSEIGTGGLQRATVTRPPADSMRHHPGIRRFLQLPDTDPQRAAQALAGHRETMRAGLPKPHVSQRPGGAPDREILEQEGRAARRTLRGVQKLDTDEGSVAARLAARVQESLPRTRARLEKSYARAAKRYRPDVARSLRQRREDAMSNLELLDAKQQSLLERYGAGRAGLTPEQLSGRLDGALAHTATKKQRAALIRERVLGNLSESARARLQQVERDRAMFESPVTNANLLEHLKKRERTLHDKFLGGMQGRVDALTGIPGSGKSAVGYLERTMQANRDKPIPALEELLRSHMESRLPKLPPEPAPAPVPAAQPPAAAAPVPPPAAPRPMPLAPWRKPRTPAVPADPPWAGQPPAFPIPVPADASMTRAPAQAGEEDAYRALGLQYVPGVR